VEFDGLSDLIATTFAPDTLETMAEKFGLTNDEIREMSELLGLDIQTDFERLAASMGLTVAEAKQLGAALESKVGIPAEQLAEFLESSGLSAKELADALGVDVGKGADIVADAQARANERIREGANLAGRMADEFERARRASDGIGFGAPDIPTTGAQSGFEGRVTGPRAFVIEPGITEDVSIRRPGSQGASSTVVNVTNNFPGVVFADEHQFNEDLIQRTKRAFEENALGIQESVSR